MQRLQPAALRASMHGVRLVANIGIGPTSIRPAERLVHDLHANPRVPTTFVVNRMNDGSADLLVHPPPPSLLCRYAWRSRNWQTRAATAARGWTVPEQETADA